MKPEATETLPGVPPHGMKGELLSSEAGDGAWVLWVGVLLGITLMILIGGRYFWYWLKQRKNKKSAIPTSFESTPWELLLNQINGVVLPSLEGDGAQIDQEWVRFTGEVSLYLRRALELKTGLPFAERTSYEIKRILTTGSEFLKEPDLQERLTKLLDDLDMIRFAGKHPSSHVAETYLNELKDWTQRLEQRTTNSRLGENEAKSLTAEDLVQGERGLRVFDR